MSLRVSLLTLPSFVVTMKGVTATQRERQYCSILAEMDSVDTDLRGASPVGMLPGQATSIRSPTGDEGLGRTSNHFSDRFQVQ